MARVKLFDFLDEVDPGQAGDETIHVYYYESGIFLPDGSGPYNILPLIEVDVQGTIQEVPISSDDLATSTNVGAGTLPYSFCTGTTLTSFDKQDAWPFAVLQTTLDSPTCIVGVCDILIQRPIETTRDTGAGDGTATVTIISEKVGNETLEYSLDEVNWTVISAFPLVLSDLVEGDYRIFVREQLVPTCFDSSPFSINSTDQITYGPYIVNEFINFHGQTCRIEIHQRDYTGPSKEAEVAFSPCFPNLLPRDKTDVIHGSELIIRLLAESNFEYIELYNADDRKFKVFAKIEGATVWQGFIKQEYSEPYWSEENYYVDVRATDGLGRLKFKDFRDSDGQVISGRRTQFDIIKICLDKLDLEAQIINHIDIVENDYFSTPTADMLTFTEVLADIYKDSNCYEVIEDILQPYFAFIRHVDGDWHIYRVPQLNNDSVYRRIYSKDGVFTDNETIDLRKYITLPDPENDDMLSWVNRQQEMSIENPYGNIDLIFDYGLDENLIFNSDFSQINEAGRVIGFSGSAEYKRNIDKEGDYSIKIIGSVLAIGSADFIVTDKINISNAAGNLYVLKFQYSCKTVSSDTSNFVIPLRIQNGTHYLQEDGTWAAAVDEIEITPAGNNRFENFELEIQPPPNPTPIQIYFYQMITPSISSETGYEIKDLRFEFLPEGQYLEKTQTLTYRNNLFQSFGPETININHGDGPDVELATKILKNATVLINGAPTDGWKRTDRSEELTLQEIYLNDLIGQLGIPHQRLQGRLRGKYLRWNHVLIDPDQPSKRFMISSCRWDVKRCEYDIELLEIGDSESPYTLLALMTVDGLPVSLPNGQIVLLPT